jgi:predicted dehydrogenase
MPAFQKTGAVLKSIATNGGINGVHYGKKFGFQEASTDAERVFSDLETNAVVIATRHNSHARFVCEALKAGKHVFVEKPLCLTQHELDEIESVYSSLIPHPSSLVLMVGFNRRLAPQIVKIKELLQSAKSPKSFIMTVNAGQIPPDHWTQDPEVGGGRIIGEACHFIDLLLFLAGSQIVSSSIEKMRDRTGDTATIQLSFKDGSMGSIHYFSNGSRRFPKERLEIFCGGKILQLDNFRKMQGYGWPGFKSMNLWRQDKGQNAAVKAFVDAIRRGGPSPIPFEEIIEVAKVSIELAAG